MDDTTRQAARQWTLVQPAVSAFLLSVVRNPTVRDDLLQDVAVTVLQTFERYDPSRPFSAWAIGIAHNHLRLHLRRLTRDRLVFDDDVVARLADSFVATASEEASKLDHLDDCLGGLEKTARELCRLRYVEELKPAAIGERVGMSANSVAKALQRIRDRLRDCIELKSVQQQRAT
ncbi:MAG: sigma-70 family RNA polymerase sigma factor [Pirellulales bacterium]